MLENNEGRTGRFIIQELAQPYTGTPEFQEIYRKFAKRILWIDDDVCPGAFQMNTAWYFAVPERDTIFRFSIDSLPFASGGSSWTHRLCAFSAFALDLR